MADRLHRFMFQAAPVRGGIVQLRESWHEVLARRSYPEPVRALLGQMAAASVLLTASLKFDGAMIMQIHGDGPVKLLVVECQSDLGLRATATLAEDAEPIAADATLADLVNVHGGGRFAITLDPKTRAEGQQPYQGIVPLAGPDGALSDLSDVLELYMRSSEQIETRIWLAADDHCAGGLLLQKMPGHGGTATAQPVSLEQAGADPDAWERLCHLGATLTTNELLHVDSETMIRRLFLQEAEEHGVTLFTPQRARFSCSCSRTRVGAMLRMLGNAEIDSILDESGSVEVDCEFCGQHYHFDAVDCRQLFASPTISEGTRSASSSRH